MPHMDGFEFCRLLKSDIQISHIPVILLTARDNPDSLAAGYKLGADFYLAKPFDDDVLLTVIRNLLWNREQIKNYYRDAVQVSIMPKNQTFSNADEQFLLKLNKLVLDNIDNSDLDVKYLTVEMGMSRASLYNKVKALTGLGVNDLINRIRIEQAMRLLTDRRGIGAYRVFQCSLFQHLLQAIYIDDSSGVPRAEKERAIGLISNVLFFLNSLLYLF